MKSRTEILVPIAAIQAVPIAVIAWYRLHRYAWYRYSAIVTKVENGKNMMSADSVRFLVLHCSASRCNQDYSVEQLRRDHKARGFYDIGYHFYIRKDGTMTQHRKLLEVGAHARPYNRCSIGICYEGGLDEQGKPCNTMTTEQETRLIDLFRNLKILFPKAKIVGHRDLPGTTPKECPCLDAGSWAARHRLD